MWSAPDHIWLPWALDRLSDCPLIDESGPFYRGVADRHLQSAAPKPLYSGSSLLGARYTPIGGPAGLYLASDPAIVSTELRLIDLRGIVPTSAALKEPYVTLSVDARVTKVLDLTDTKIRRRLRVSLAQLRADWERGMAKHAVGRGVMPLTQRMGYAAHTTTLIRGLLVKPARARHGENLIVFPDRLVAGEDSLDVYDPTGRLSVRMP
jgi:RES domain-containing protein